MPPIITVENLGKCYRIHHEARERYTALRDVIARKAGGLLEKLKFGKQKAEIKNAEGADQSQLSQFPISALEKPSGDEDFWALKDVSFEVKQGEVVGIIGRNGAGKSTLLKILSRITEPTKGRVSLRGRVASLLEVGTGFHPELTGRENIFLNGAILGMTKVEIRAKFDEIVAFAEVERFLDTPVKRYSSGMYVRLAFAVAAHLEPEILVVDEVLAVGDAEFQRKCLGKLSEVATGGGRTVLFVSHNMVAVESLCSSAVLLAAGKVFAKGDVRSMVQQYSSELSKAQVIPLKDRIDRQGSGMIRFTSLAMLDGFGNHLTTLQCGAAARWVLGYENFSMRDLKNLSVAIGIYNSIGQRVLTLSTALLEKDLKISRPGAATILISLPRVCLVPGRYTLNIHATAQNVVVDWIQNAGFFDVEAADFYGTGQFPSNGDGLFLMDYSMQFETN
jgi:lipopolysaccharide transport system ATP-binding protein